MSNTWLTAERMSLDRVYTDSQRLVDKVFVEAFDLESLVASLKSDAATDEENTELRKQIQQELQKIASTHMQSVLQAREELHSTKKAYESVLSSAPTEASPVQCSKQFEDACMTLYDKSAHKAIVNEPYYSVVQKAINAAVSSADTDIAVVTEENTAPVLKCPILRVRMTNPMYNRACGHVYSRDGIFSVLKNKSISKCPMPGCGRMVTKAELLEHLPTKVALESAADEPESSDGGSD